MSSFCTISKHLISSNQDWGHPVPTSKYLSVPCSDVWQCACMQITKRCVWLQESTWTGTVHSLSRRVRWRCRPTCHVRLQGLCLSARMETERRRLDRSITHTRAHTQQQFTSHMLITLITCRTSSLETTLRSNRANGRDRDNDATVT